MTETRLVKILSLLLSISISLNVYLAYEYYSLSSTVRVLNGQLSRQNLLLAQLRDELSQLRPQVLVARGIVISFAPNETARYVASNGITYLSGIVTVGNLSIIKVRPIDIIFNFNVSAYGGDREGIQYKYMATYSLNEVDRGVDYVELPYTVYPITIMNQSPNTEIVFHIGIVVEIYWRDKVVAQGYALGVRSLVIVPPSEYTEGG